MPTTRSGTKRQTSLDELSNDDKSQQQTSTGAKPSNKTGTPKAQSVREANSSAKRKALPEDSKPARSKKVKRDGNDLKQSHISEDSVNDLEKPIMINRSPVLQLWAAVVANFLNRDESWTTCLSIGASIAALCAISKGRAIGKVEPKDESAAAQDKRKKRKQKDDEFRELEVMGFPMHIKDDVVVVGGKPKPLNESTLYSKFGGQEVYEKAKTTMERALRSWSEDKDELNRTAFHMYEKFRPNVASGGSGWGRKGELNLKKVKSTVEK